MLLDLSKSRPSQGAPPVVARPGSAGEHTLQEQFGTVARAAAFYDNQVLDYLNEAMRELISRMEMVVVATADAHGECDASFRAGEPGFVHVLNGSTVAYPEYRGNGVMASLGNMTENPHVGLLFVDFFKAKIGLHINGRAQILGSADMLHLAGLPQNLRTELEREDGRKAEHWVVVSVEEAYIHCSKHIPMLRKARSGEETAWGTDDVTAKGGDYFGVAAARRSVLFEAVRRIGRG